jgi:hypothetical protein
MIGTDAALELRFDAVDGFGDDRGLVGFVLQGPLDGAVADELPARVAHRQGMPRRSP